MKDVFCSVPGKEDQRRQGLVDPLLMPDGPDLRRGHHRVHAGDPERHQWVPRLAATYVQQRLLDVDEHHERSATWQRLGGAVKVPEAVPLPRRLVSVGRDTWSHRPTLCEKRLRQTREAGHARRARQARPIAQPVSDEVLEWGRGVADARQPQGHAGVRARIRVDRLPSGPLRADRADAHRARHCDETVPIDATARVAAQMIAHAQLIEYVGASHGLFVTHKERLSADLLAFLRS